MRELMLFEWGGNTIKKFDLKIQTEITQHVIEVIVNWMKIDVYPPTAFSNFQHLCHSYIIKMFLSLFRQVTM